MHKSTANTIKALDSGSEILDRYTAYTRAKWEIDDDPGLFRSVRDKITEFYNWYKEITRAQLAHDYSGNSMLIKTIERLRRVNSHPKLQP